MFTAPVGLFVPKTDSYDADAQAYLEAIGVPNDGTVYYESTAQEITGAEIWDAVNTFVIGWKAAGLWVKSKAVYPIIGGTATAHKYNLINPLDLDAAFRLTYSGSFTHSGTGQKLNSLSGTPHAETYLSENAELEQDNVHIGSYSRTNSAGVTVDIGAYNSGSLNTNILPNLGGKFYFRVQNTNAGYSVNLDTRGWFVSNRVNSTQVFGYKNTTKYIVSSASTGKVSNTFWLHSMKGAPNPSLRELCFATIGYGLTDQEQSDGYTLIQALQTALHRQV